MRKFLRGTYTLGEGTTRTDEETSTNRTTNGNHVQVTALHGTVHLHQATAVVTAPERVDAETDTGQEGLIVIDVVNLVVVFGGRDVCLVNGHLIDALLAAVIDGDGVLGGHGGRCDGDEPTLGLGSVRPRPCERGRKGRKT